MDYNDGVSRNYFNSNGYGVSPSNGVTTPIERQTTKAISAITPTMTVGTLGMLKNNRLMPKLSGVLAHHGYREGNSGGGFICVGVINMPKPIINNITPAGNVALPPSIAPSIADEIGYVNCD